MATPVAPLGGKLPPVLQPEEGVSFWRPKTTNGYVTVKTSPSYGGPAGITMRIQVIAPGGFLAEQSHAPQVATLFCFEASRPLEVPAARPPLVPPTPIRPPPRPKHK